MILIQKHLGNLFEHYIIFVDDMKKIVRSRYISLCLGLFSYQFSKNRTTFWMQSNRPQKQLPHSPAQFKNKKTTADNGNQPKQKNHNRKSKDDAGPMETS